MVIPENRDAGLNRRLRRSAKFCNNLWPFTRDSLFPYDTSQLETMFNCIFQMILSTLIDWWKVFVCRCYKQPNVTIIFCPTKLLHEAKISPHSQWPILDNASLILKETPMICLALFAWMGIEHISGNDTFAYNCEQLLSNFLLCKRLLVVVMWSST